MLVLGHDDGNTINEGEDSRDFDVSLVNKPRNGQWRSVTFAPQIFCEIHNSANFTKHSIDTPV